MDQHVAPGVHNADLSWQRDDLAVAVEVYVLHIKRYDLESQL
jgi:hypothetical protein